MDYMAKINQLKTALEKAKADRIRAEQNLENLKKRRAEIEAEIRALGTEPANLETTISKLNENISAALLEVENMIPAQYR